MILPQFIAVLIASFALWHLPGILGFYVGMLQMVIIFPMVVPRRRKS